jgi:hypothetical protein
MDNKEITRVYEDVLQNIEFAIVDTYRGHSDMTDYNVQRALEVLMDAYSGERIGRPARDFRVSEVERRLMDEMRAMCEWRLGRADAPVDVPLAADQSGPDHVAMDEILLCLKRILKSTKTWNKGGGMRGYLSFIVQYIG